MLSDYQFKTFYSTKYDNIPKQFYNLALQESISYSRVSGYFSSKALAFYSQGIESLIKNNGKYKLIISHEISEDDYQAIINGYMFRTKEITKDLVNRLETSSLDSFQLMNLSNLSYLIEIGLVDIKIGFTHDGLFHAKYGLFKDSDGNLIYFSGSLNETAAAFNHNYEEIMVYKSWESSKSELEKKEIEFEDLWSNSKSNDMVFVKSINEIVVEKLITFSKGRLMVNKQLFEKDILILNYDKGLELINNLSEPLKMTERSIKVLIDNYMDKNVTVFNNNLTYLDIQKIIKLFQRYSKRTGQRLVIANSVLEFIAESEYQIKEYSKLGLAIKSKDVILNKDFLIFDEILEEEIERKLYPSQSWVSYYQAKMKRSANFSVPGSGKTSMIYGTYAYLSSNAINKIDTIVVVGPKNSFLAWKEEFEFVFGEKRKLNVLDIHDPTFKREQFYRNPDLYNLVLVNYEALLSYEKELNQFITERTMLVFDEVHKIKSIVSKRAALAIQLALKTKYRYVLTGTPIPNTYQDIWNFLQILFGIEFQNYFTFSLNELSAPDALSVEKINNQIEPFFWRITKRDLGVPKENRDVLISATVTEDEQSLIDYLWRKYGHSPFKLYIRLIQLSSNPELLKKNLDDSMYGLHSDVVLDDELEDPIWYTEDIPCLSESEIELIDRVNCSSKFYKCIEKAEELINQGRVIVIWCIFIDTMEKLSAKLSKMGYKVAVVNGLIPNNVREEIIVDFQKGLYDVLITNPHTLAESVSLHMVSHDALYLEYSFNLTHMLQSRDRIHRLGLSEGQETNYYYFLLEGQHGKRSTIDRLIYDRLLVKRDTMINAIERSVITPIFDIDEKAEILALMETEL